MKCRQTLQHADHARRAARNEANVQLCQPNLPESRVRGVVGVRVLAVRALLDYCWSSRCFCTLNTCWFDDLSREQSENR